MIDRNGGGDFGEYVFTGSQGFEALRYVQLHRGGDDHQVDVRIQQRSEIG